MKFIIWVRRLFCKHDWDAVGDFMSPHYVPWYVCKKCGKEEGL